jgi:Icc-related predicted phosphoesterase
MKIKYMSDLHLEFGSLDVDPDNDADVLILAGDINIKQRVEWINEQAERFEHVIYVPGNHEYYRSNMDCADEYLADDLDPRVHFLQNSSVKIEDKWFHGSTLWTDYQGMGNQPLSMIDANERMSDHRIIRHTDDYRKFRAEDAAHVHMKARAYLVNNVKEGDVVITHHAPHENSSHEYFKGTPLSASYYSDLTVFMMTFKPSYWIHGHMHNTSDYVIDQTRVLCNPRGYAPSDLNIDFDINKTFEV